MDGRKAVPTVRVMILSDAGQNNTLVLPGNLQAFYAAPVYARVTGYLRHWCTDIGALIVVGTPTDLPLFTVCDGHKLGTYVSVPQDYSALVQPGMMVTFTAPQYPDRTFTATLAATSGAVNIQNGTPLSPISPSGRATMRRFVS
jgi:multidrug efflux pump subunit AcrA (membrane-fusion protein)